MFSNTSAVRQVTQATEPHGEDRFRLIDELPLVDINGFSFVSSADLTESDALNYPAHGDVERLAESSLYPFVQYVWNVVTEIAAHR